jgi:hypothetical protein
MMPVPEIIAWLQTLAPGSEVGIDDGGLCLWEVLKEGQMSEAYCEIGGIPKEIEYAKTQP